MLYQFTSLNVVSITMLVMAWQEGYFGDLNTILFILRYPNRFYGAPCLVLAWDTTQISDSSLCSCAAVD